MLLTSPFSHASHTAGARRVTTSYSKCLASSDAIALVQVGHPLILRTAKAKSLLPVNSSAMFKGSCNLIPISGTGTTLASIKSPAAIGFRKVMSIRGWVAFVTKVGAAELPTTRTTNPAASTQTEEFSTLTLKSPQTITGTSPNERASGKYVV